MPRAIGHIYLFIIVRWAQKNTNMYWCKVLLSARGESWEIAISITIIIIIARLTMPLWRTNALDCSSYPTRKRIAITAVNGTEIITNEYRTGFYCVAHYAGGFKFWMMTSSRQTINLKKKIIFFLCLTTPRHYNFLSTLEIISKSIWCESSDDKIQATYWTTHVAHFF